MPDQSAVPLPLSGIKVVDLTRALAGPFCTALLGDFGAEVIKVEGLPGGDATRAWPPFDDDRSLYYMSTNRNKRSIALDMRAPESQQILAKLVADADVLVENFRPGVLAKLGLDPQRLREERPDLVISSVTGFGEVGPRATDAGLDQVAQGMAGLMSVTGAGEQTPMRFGVPIADMTAGMYSAFGIAASLAGRPRNGRASRVSTSLLEGAVSLLSFQAQRFLSAGEVPQPQGNDHPIISPYGTFRAADTSLNVAVGTEAQWFVLCEILGAPDLATHPDYSHPALRAANRQPLYVELNKLFAAEPASSWLAQLGAAGVPCGPIHSVDEVFADPQVEAVGMVQKVPGRPDDRLLRGPLSIDGQPVGIHRAPPALGEHSYEILTGLGYRPQTIDELMDRGIVGEPKGATVARAS